MREVQALALVLVLIGIAFGGATFVPAVFAIAVPYAAIVIFLVGITLHIVTWARSPVPFKIPSVCGQQRSLPWIRQQGLESPFTRWQVVERMALEILLFRSLFRNTRSVLTRNQRLVYQPDKTLWLGALVFHWSLLIIVLRHLRYFLQPVPRSMQLLWACDGILQLLVPTLLITDVLFVCALLYLLGRRLFHPLVRYISLPADFFPLLLMLGIAISGILLRYTDRVDLIAVKKLALGLTVFHPIIPQGLSALFYVHLLLVSSLIAYIPFSKLMHVGGVFLTPTRNLPNNNRARRHINPWNHPVPVHTYAEWEAEFHDKLAAAGIPMEDDDR